MFALFALAAPLTFGVATAAAVTFVPAAGSPVALGHSAWGQAVADFDGDGHLDVATANSADDTMTVLLGDGAGGFAAAPGSPVAVGDAPWGLAAADFNGDGHVDVAVARRHSNDLRLFLGNGAGGFTGGNAYAAGDAPVEVVAGDFNGDGNRDVAVGCVGASTTVRVLFGDGAGALPTTTVVAIDGMPWTMAVADFNGDGRQDLAVGDYGTSTITILLGASGGTFTTSSVHPSGAYPRGIGVGDFDNDGRLDLGVSDQIDCVVTFLRGDGSGGFSNAGTFATGVQPLDAGAGDFDGDGNLDIVTVNYGDGGLSVLLGDGQGSFAAPVSPGPVSYPYTGVVSDLNGDGRPDVTLVKGNAAGLDVLLNATPSARMVVDGGAAWTNQHGVTIDSSHPLDVAEMRVRDQGGAWSAWRPYEAQVVWSLPGGDGTKTVEVQYRSADDDSPVTNDSILLDTTAPTTACDAPPDWVHTPAVTVTLTPDDGAGSGMGGGAAKTEYKLDDAVAWSTGTSVPVSGDGVHTLRYRSTDAAGNVALVESRAVKIDTVAPTVTLWGADDLWHSVFPVLLVTADDGAGSGIASAGAMIDGVWHEGSLLVVAGDGDQVVVPGATDRAGNAATGATAYHAKVDTRGPVTSGRAASAGHGGLATLRVRVADPSPGSPTADITVRIWNDSGWLVKTVKAAARATNTTVLVAFRCRLPRGTFTYRVYATDAAGNRQRRVGRALLEVR